MTKPNFLYIGPDKSGSSWIFRLLRKHPDCFVPDCKDIYFFDRYYNRGLDWYLTFFSDAVLERAVGELSHDYLFSSVAASRIKTDFPCLKVMACLRHPSERAFSHYLYMVRSGRTRLSFMEAIEKFPEIIDHSLYYKHLKVFFVFFSEENIKILYFDDLEKDPRQFSKDIFEFLGVSIELNNFEFDKKERAASAPRIFWVASVIKKMANVARFLRLERLVGFVKHHRWSKILYHEYTENTRPQLSDNERSFLSIHFERDLQLLESLLKVDLGHWR